MLSVVGKNKLLLVSFDDGDTVTMKECLTRFSPEERSFRLASELSLRGEPFLHLSHDKGDRVGGHMLLCQVVQALKWRGWNCLSSVNFRRRLQEQTSLIFVRSQPASVRVACLTPLDSNKLKLVNFGPASTVALSSAVLDGYQMGIKRQQTRAQEHQITLAGNPWDSSSWGDGFYARTMLMKVIINHFRGQNKASQKFYNINSRLFELLETTVGGFLHLDACVIEKRNFLISAQTSRMKIITKMSTHSFSYLLTNKTFIKNITLLTVHAM